MITLQQIFNAAWQAFIVERRPPAINRDGYCKYLTEEGRKCAVGLCLPDGHPSQQMIGLLSDAVHLYPELFSDSVVVCQYSWLDEFQAQLQDHLQILGKWPAPEIMESRYRQVAADYKLSIPGEVCSTATQTVTLCSDDSSPA